MGGSGSLTDAELSEYAGLGAEDLLAWALRRYGPRIALASSFGAEDVVILDMMSRLGGGHAFTLDTWRLPQETYDVIDAIRGRYGIDVEVYTPDAAAVERMIRLHGYNLFYASVDLRRMCCGIRKVEPLERALRGLDAWITGLRRDQEPSRRNTRKVERDALRPGKIKVSPLADWTWDAVWAYIREHDVPYNKLHDRGYPSIGCAPCTRAVAPGDDLRAGRWWWERDTAKECGLHADPFASAPRVAGLGGR
jgi:phosphoadenosine phosphosulfate reductase